MSILTTIRDYVYTKILVKKTADQFYFANDFVLERTWRPWETLENLFDPRQYPSGKVYVIGGRPGDAVSIGRTNPTSPRDYPVMIGFQHAVSDLESYSEVDQYVGFVEELEELCRFEIDTDLLNIQFNRIEPLRDANGVPYQFVLQREANLFEAYFTAFYQRPLGSYNESTTTT